MDFDNIDDIFSDEAIAEAESKREEQLLQDEIPIEADNDCGDSCTI